MEITLEAWMNGIRYRATFDAENIDDVCRHANDEFRRQARLWYPENGFIILRCGNQIADLRGPKLKIGRGMIEKYPTFFTSCVEERLGQIRVDDFE